MFMNLQLVFANKFGVNCMSSMSSCQPHLLLLETTTEAVWGQTYSYWVGSLTERLGSTKRNWLQQMFPHSRRWVYLIF